MTKTEREVWVAAFAASNIAGDAVPAARAHAAVLAFRDAERRFGLYGDESWIVPVRAMLREVLAADGGEDG
jgi:hypothetical protein